MSFVLGLVHCQPWPKILIDILLIGPGTVELIQVSGGRASQMLRQCVDWNNWLASLNVLMTFLSQVDIGSSSGHSSLGEGDITVSIEAFSLYSGHHLCTSFLYLPFAAVILLVNFVLMRVSQLSPSRA